MLFTTSEGPVSVTHYLAANHEDGALNEYREAFGECYFCGHDGAGSPADSSERVGLSH